MCWVGGRCLIAGPDARESVQGPDWPSPWFCGPWGGKTATLTGPPDWLCRYWKQGGPCTPVDAPVGCAIVILTGGNPPRVAGARRRVGAWGRQASGIELTTACDSRRAQRLDVAFADEFGELRIVRERVNRMPFFFC